MAESPKASTGGRGSMGGGLSASAVDTDKLWRDRIRQELQFQRQWRDEYGSSMGSPASARSTTMSASNNNTINNDGGEATTADNNNNNNNNAGQQHEQQAFAQSARSQEEISARSHELVATLLNSHTRVGTACASVDVTEITNADLKELQNTLQKAQYTSTTMSSYKFDRSKLLELSGGGHRKMKFRV